MPTHNGGKPDVKPLPYATPQGPSDRHHDNYGSGQKPVCNGPESGSPGLGGSNHGNAGTQGHR